MKIRIEFATHDPRAAFDPDILKTSGRHGALAVVLCKANAAMTTPTGLGALWWPLFGTISIASGDTKVQFERRWIYVGDSQREHSVAAGSHGLAIGIIANQGTWNVLGNAAAGFAQCGPALFPALHRADAPVRHNLLRFLRMATHHSGHSLELHRFIHLAETVAALQSPLQPLIDACPGHSLARRKVVFLRLQRVRNHVLNSATVRQDVAQLATMASYSVWRFIRVFKATFGETPYAFISRCRLRRAQQLLDLTDLPVGDVAYAAGFESRATLMRALRRQRQASTLPRASTG